MGMNLLRAQEHPSFASSLQPRRRCSWCCCLRRHCIDNDYDDTDTNGGSGGLCPPCMPPAVSGGLMAAAMWIVVDVYVMAAHGHGPRPQPWHWVPAIVGLTAFVMMTLTPWQHLQQQQDDATWYDTGGDGGGAGCARCWLFSTFVMSFAAIMTAIVLATSFPPLPPPPAQVQHPKSGIPDAELNVAMALQAVLFMAATLCWGWGRQSHQTRDN